MTLDTAFVYCFQQCVNQIKFGFICRALLTLGTVPKQLYKNPDLDFAQEATVAGKNSLSRNEEQTLTGTRHKWETLLQ